MLYEQIIRNDIVFIENQKKGAHKAEQHEWEGRRLRARASEMDEKECTKINMPRDMSNSNASSVENHLNVISMFCVALFFLLRQRKKPTN